MTRFTFVREGALDALVVLLGFGDELVEEELLGLGELGAEAPEPP